MKLLQFQIHEHSIQVHVDKKIILNKNQEKQKTFY